MVSFVSYLETWRHIDENKKFKNVMKSDLFHERGTSQGWIHQTSNVHYHSSTAFWSTAASFRWHSAHLSG